MTNASITSLWTLLASAALVGCASNVKLDDKPAPVESRTSGTSASGTSSATTRPKASGTDLSKSNDSAASLGRVVYFDYDSFVVKDEFRPIVEGQAKLAASDTKTKLSVEGHADERGGSEYNLALGQKRAQAVVKAMTLLGASELQLEPVSFGKERPVVQGHDEEAWAKNRRVELNKR